MNDRRDYLLRHGEQIADFRARYARFIEKYRETYRAWFMRQPLWEWVPLPSMDERTAKAVIGLLCILYIDGEINLTVHETVRYVRRDALNDEEIKEWCDAHQYKRKAASNKR